MKTTIDLPDSLFHRAKIAAAERRTTLKDLVIAGLTLVTAQGDDRAGREEALARLQRGFHLGGKALLREEAHARAALP
jgi:CRP-like cAMP-binding protein